MNLTPVATATQSQNVPASIPAIASRISVSAMTVSPASFSIGCVSSAQKHSTVNQALRTVKRRLRVGPFGMRRPTMARIAITRA